MERRTIAGRYELLEQLGDSSWRATDTELGREVLIRLPVGAVAGVALAHPNIVRVFDHGEVDGEPFAVLEYLPGGSLEQRLAAGPLSEAEASSVAADIEAALAYAHEQGVTHGSLSPANVLLDGEGRAKLTGFAGDAEPEEDRLALAALLQTLGAAAVAVPEADVTEVMQAPPPARNRRTPALVAAATLALITAGIGAAFLATSDDAAPEPTTGSLSVPVPTGSTEATTEAPVVSEPSTTAETTTAPATTSEPPPATTAPPPPTTEPTPTTTPPPPPTTTEAPPPTTTEEPPPPTTAATTAAVTETTPG